MNKVVVLGGTGEMGSRVVEELRRRNHDVTSASRASDVDVVSGRGLTEALAGADCVVDCLNHTTVSRRGAVSFFETTAGNVLNAASAGNVGHIVCLSIVNVADARVRKAMGYYGGKAVQEETYTAGSIPVTLVRTTAWFSLAQTFLHQIRLGRLAIVPRMRLRPIHPDAACALIADAVESEPRPSDTVAVREMAGPEEIDAAALAQRFAAANHLDIRVVGVPIPMRGLRLGLLPGRSVAVDSRRLADWLLPQAETHP